MSNKLEKRSDELEQTLAKQLEMLKRESEDWLKVGAVVAAGVLLTYGVVKATQKKKVKPTERALKALEKEGLLNDDIKKRLTTPKSSGFWPSLTQRLLILGLALAKEKLFVNPIASPAENSAREEGK